MRLNPKTNAYDPMTDFTGLHTIKADKVETSTEMGEMKLERFTTAYYKERPVAYITDTGQYSEVDPIYARTSMENESVWYWRDGRWIYVGVQPAEPIDPSREINEADVAPEIRKVVDISMKAFPNSDKYTINGWVKNPDTGEIGVWFNNRGKMGDEQLFALVYNYPGVGSLFSIVSSAAGDAYRKYALLTEGNDQVVPAWHFNKPDNIKKLIDMLRVMDQQIEHTTFPDAKALDEYAASHPVPHPEQELHLVMLYMPLEDQSRIIGFPWKPNEYSTGSGYNPGRDIVQVKVDGKEHRVILSGMCTNPLVKDNEFTTAITMGRGVEGIWVNKQTGVAESQEMLMRGGFLSSTDLASTWMSCAEIVAQKRQYFLEPNVQIGIGATMDSSEMRNFATFTGLFVTKSLMKTLKMNGFFIYFCLYTSTDYWKLMDYLNKDQPIPSDVLQNLKSVYIDAFQEFGFFSGVTYAHL